MPYLPKTNSQRNKENSPFKKFYEKQEKLQKKEHEKKRGTAAQRGYGSRWQKTRIGFLKKHPLCVECLRNGITKEATVVDHIIPHRGDMKLFWDSKNWQSLCKQCHDKKTARGE